MMYRHIERKEIILFYFYLFITYYLVVNAQAYPQIIPLRQFLKWQLRFFFFTLYVEVIILRFLMCLNLRFCFS